MSNTNQSKEEGRSMDEVIDVCCIATPDGQTFWCESDPATVASFWTNWRNALPAETRQQFEARGVVGGIVKIRMLRSYYQRIPATVQSAALFGSSQSEAR